MVGLASLVEVGIFASDHLQDYRRLTVSFIVRYRRHVTTPVIASLEQQVLARKVLMSVIAGDSHYTYTLRQQPT